MNSKLTPQTERLELSVFLRNHLASVKWIRIKNSTQFSTTKATEKMDQPNPKPSANSTIRNLHSITERVFRTRQRKTRYNPITPLQSSRSRSARNSAREGASHNGILIAFKRKHIHHSAERKPSSLHSRTSRNRESRQRRPDAFFNQRP